jgi:hypothetical protein
MCERAAGIWTFELNRIKWKGGSGNLAAAA